MSFIATFNPLNSILSESNPKHDWIWSVKLQNNGGFLSPNLDFAIYVYSQKQLTFRVSVVVHVHIWHVECPLVSNQWQAVAVCISIKFWEFHFAFAITCKEDSI